MTFGQLMDITCETYFLKNHTQNVVEKLVPDPVLKNQLVFIVCQVEHCRNILKLSCRPAAFTSLKGYLQNKKRSGTSPPALSSAFLKKNISLVIFY